MCVCVFWTFPNDVGSSIVLNNSVILVQYIIKIIIHKSIKKKKTNKKQLKEKWLYDWNPGFSKWTDGMKDI